MQTMDESDIQELEKGCNNMTLETEEERGVDLPDEVDEQSPNINLRFAMVGKFLTDKHIKFEYMQQVLASVWRSVMGMRVKEIRANLFVFQFFHENDIARVLDKGPWGFENYTLICKRLGPEDIPENISMFLLDIWVQIFDLPCGYMSEKIASLIGNHVGNFISSDPNNFLGGWKSYLRIRVSIDVRLPLKRKMKMKKRDGSYFWVSFKYERLDTFCYFCGILGHAMQFCRKAYEVKIPPEDLLYGAWLRAKPRTPTNMIGSRWIVDEKAGKTEVEAEGDEDRHAGGSSEHLIITEEQTSMSKTPNKTTQEDIPPTIDFKRRRSDGGSADGRNEFYSTNI